MTEQSIVILSEDPLLLGAVQRAAAKVGSECVVADTPAAFVAAMDRTFPVWSLVDLATTGDWITAIEQCKLRPHSKQIPIHAVGGERDIRQREAAQRAGVDQLWTHAQLLVALDQVVAHHVQPPVNYPAGWDAPLSERARKGLEEFNRGDYFAQHEELEAAWIAETAPIREMYQGILQIGLAFYQIEHNNWQGAVKMFRRGLPKLRRLPAKCQGIDIAELRASAEAIHDEITALGPERLQEFDQRRFPRIRFADQAGEQ